MCPFLTHPIPCVSTTIFRDSRSYARWCSARLCHHTPPGTHRTPQSQRTPKKLKDQKACESSAGQSATYHCSIIGFVFGAVAAPGAFGFRRPGGRSVGGDQTRWIHRQKPIEKHIEKSLDFKTLGLTPSDRAAVGDPPGVANRLRGRRLATPPPLGRKRWLATPRGSPTAAGDRTTQKAISGCVCLFWGNIREFPRGSAGGRAKVAGSNPPAVAFKTSCGRLLCPKKLEVSK